MSSEPNEGLFGGPTPADPEPEPTMPPEAPKAKKGRKKKGDGKMPVVATVDSPEDPAADLLKRRWAKEAQENMARAKADAEANQYYLRCPKNGQHHAAYLTEKPAGEIHPGMWFSVLHEVGAPWPHTFIKCQECAINNDGGYSNASVVPTRRTSEGSIVFALDGPEEYVLGKISRDAAAERQGELTGDDDEGDDNG